MTTLSLSTVHCLSSAAVIESLLIFLRIISLKKSWVAENRNLAARAWSLNTIAVLWRPPPTDEVYLSNISALIKVEEQLVNILL